MNINIYELALNKKSIIFDFDGVIKESVFIKGETFVNIFSKYPKLKKRILKYHLNNSGVSRDNKIKKFMQWSNEDSSKFLYFKNKFSKNVVSSVIDTAWVDGVIDFIKKNKKKKLFIVSATPEKELFEITKKLNIFKYFTNLYGYPNNKIDSIQSIIKNYKVLAEDTIFIGDAKIDYLSAKINKVKFILRKTSYNKSLHKKNINYIIDFKKNEK